jgi:ADP-heptose:LPS heptosyltransferase
MQHVHKLDSAARLIVIGAPNETARAKRIADLGGGIHVPTPSLREVLALVATSDFVFTPDTSVAHAASAFTRPSVAIFVRGKPERWGLYDTLSVNVEHSDNTLATLPLDRVIAAVDNVWRKMAGDQASAND